MSQKMEYDSCNNTDSFPNIALVGQNENGYIVMIVIDNFNDNIKLEGFATAEILSQKIKRLIQENIPENAIVYHVNPNRFIIKFPEFEDSDVYSWVSKFKEIKTCQIVIDQPGIKPEMSLGAVAYPAYGKTNEELIMNIQMNCDQNSYLCRQTQIKNYSMHKCNNEFRVYSQEDRTLYTQRIALESSIRKAVENNFDGFEIYYQPQINAKTGVCTSAEALLRWKDKTGKIIMPSLLIPALESMQLISKTDSWVMKESMEQCKDWTEKGAPKGFSISVNLTSSKLIEKDLAEQILDVLNQHNLSPDCLTVELTETSFMHEIQYGIDLFKQIRGYGISVSIDDFGTGYSALNYLSRLPIDELKIDSSFIANMEIDDASKNVVEAVVEIAHSLGLRVCAEGVETKSQLKILIELGVDLLQGYLYSMPINSKEFESRYIIKQ